MWWKRKKKIEPIPEFDLSNFKMPIVKNYPGVPSWDIFDGPLMTAPVPDGISFKVVHRNWFMRLVWGLRYRIHRSWREGR